MTNDTAPESAPPAAIPAPAANVSSLSLRSLGDGTFEVSSVKRKRDGELEATLYIVYAQSLRCSCPSGLRGGDRAGLCKHARFVDAYLSGMGPDHLENVR
jgi:hypothetical protein